MLYPVTTKTCCIWSQQEHAVLIHNKNMLYLVTTRACCIKSQQEHASSGQNKNMLYPVITRTCYIQSQQERAAYGHAVSFITVLTYQQNYLVQKNNKVSGYDNNFDQFQVTQMMHLMQGKPQKQDLYNKYLLVRCASTKQVVIIIIIVYVCMYCFNVVIQQQTASQGKPTRYSVFYMLIKTHEAQ